MCIGGKLDIKTHPLNSIKASLLCPLLKRQGLQKGSWVCMCNRYILLLKITTLCCLLLLFLLCQDFSPILQKVLGPQFLVSGWAHILLSEPADWYSRGYCPPDGWACTSCPVLNREPKIPGSFLPTFSFKLISYTCYLNFFAPSHLPAQWKLIIKMKRGLWGEQSWSETLWVLLGSFVK